MYRLMLYFLLVLWTIALVFSFLRIIDINPISLVLSTLFIIFICWITNKTLAVFFKAPVNCESVYITALILSLIISPANSIQDLILPLAVSIFAIASKFIVAIKYKHIFNPVAFGIAAGALVLHQQASWWIGVLPMWPFILIGGLLVVRKIQRFNLVLTFFIVTIAASLWKGLASNAVGRLDHVLGWNVNMMKQILLDAQAFFFAFVMLTEPQTTPPKKNLTIAYGGLVGLATFFFTPELALMAGNLLSYLVSPKFKLLLSLDQKREIAPNTYDFTLHPNQKFNFLPGQYLEWTLNQPKPDTRGNRRYFTIASSPTEKNIHLGIKFYEKGSSFKRRLLEMKPGDTIVGSQLSGEFTLPNNPNIPLVFLAGGIGITPFRSMIKYLFDIKQKRPITLIYAAKTEADFAYKDLFDKSQKELGIKILYHTDLQGKVDEQLIKKKVADLKNSLFYLSGPHGMVSSFEQLLKGMRIPSNQIKIDFFPGYA